MSIVSRMRCSARLAAIAVLVTALPAFSQQTVRFAGMGDSIGEGVQSADASAVTQRASFLSMIATRMGAGLPLPLIRTSLLGTVGDTVVRRRIDPGVRSQNLAVSGASAGSLLRRMATATTVSQIDSETDLVLFPEVGSQIEVFERLAPEYAAIWIGNNNALEAALSYDHLDGSQVTPVDEFARDFGEIVARVEATGAKAAFGTIPDITSIGFLVGPAEVRQMLGDAYGLADGDLTSLAAVYLVKLGLESPTLFLDPDFVLDAAEQATVRASVAALNDVIRRTVAAHGFALADTARFFDAVQTSPLRILGVPLTTRFLGGLLSLDGVHPSNVGQGLVARLFIEALNSRYGAGIAALDDAALQRLMLADPHVDRDGDGRVRGRFGVGLLETAMGLLEVSGDWNDRVPAPGARTQARSTTGGSTEQARAWTDARRAAFFRDFAARGGRDLRRLSRAERLAAVRALFTTGAPE